MSGDTTRDRHRADTVAARATGVGIGFLVFMLTWLVANRLTGLVTDAPVGPTVALVLATVAGLVGGVVWGRRLEASVTTGRPDRPTGNREPQ